MNRQIIEKAEREELFNSIATNESVQPETWYEDAEHADSDDEENGIVAMAQIFRARDGRGWIVHYNWPVDEDGNDVKDQPEAVDVWMIEELPGYALRVVENGTIIRIRSSNGDVWEVPTTEDEGLWDSIEKYDNANGTTLYDDIIEGVGCNYYWEE